MTPGLGGSAASFSLLSSRLSAGADSNGGHEADFRQRSQRWLAQLLESGDAGSPFNRAFNALRSCSLKPSKAAPLATMKGFER